jgi:hypothetical protein
MMPRRPWPIWCYTILFVASAGIPLRPQEWDRSLPLGFVVFALLVIGTTYAVLRRYDAETRLLSWRRDRPVRSILATTAATAASGLLLWGAAQDLAWARNLADRWEELLFVAGALVWLLLMRAAFVDRLGRDGAAPRPVPSAGFTAWRRGAAILAAIALGSGLAALELALRLRDANKHLAVRSREAPFVEDALNREASREGGMPREELLRAVFPVAMRLPDRTCVELRSRPGWMGRAVHYCYRDHQLDAVEVVREGE